MALRRVVCPLLIGLAMLPSAPTVSAQEGVRSPGFDADSAVRRYRDQRLSSAYYDPSDRVPKLAYGPSSPERSVQPPKMDVHAGVRGFAVRRCEGCHENAVTVSHTVKGNITCRQCHGENPIASTMHYFSPMNPIRRHAYVCAKCHEGASASFATYVVHESREITPAVRETFPALYWAHVLMLALIVGVMLIFVPHGIAWWIREWFVKRRNSGG